MAGKTTRVRTDTLMRRIIKADALEDCLRQNEASMEKRDFRAHIHALCRQRNTVPERVIRKSEIERGYGHQLFNGTRRPSRDKVIQLALGFGLSVEETQALLRQAGHSPLYPRLRRDAALIFCLGKGMSVLETQALLDKYGITLLGGVEKHDDE